MDTSVFAPHEDKYRQEVLFDTWGHLAMRPNRRYYGEMVFMIAPYGGAYTIIKADFPSVDDSPWFHDAMMDLVENEAKEQGKVYKFQGYIKNYKWYGQVEEVAL